MITKLLFDLWVSINSWQKPAKRVIEWLLCKDDHSGQGWIARWNAICASKCLSVLTTQIYYLPVSSHLRNRKLNRYRQCWLACLRLWSRTFQVQRMGCFNKRVTCSNESKRYDTSINACHWRVQQTTTKEVVLFVKMSNYPICRHTPEAYSLSSSSDSSSSPSSSDSSPPASSSCV